HQDIFDTNNGGLFYKFDATPAVFSVTDNRIANQSMVGANSAYFFLGYLTNSHFDNNEVLNSPSREFVNVFGTLSNSTFDNNTLTNSNGAVALFADAPGGKVNSNTLTNVTANAIYAATNTGHTV